MQTFRHGVAARVSAPGGDFGGSGRTGAPQWDGLPSAVALDGAAAPSPINGAAAPSPIDSAPPAFPFPALPDALHAPVSSQTSNPALPQENGNASISTSVAATGNALIDGMLAGVKWSGAVTYADTDSPTDYPVGYSSDGDGNGISAQNEGFSQFNSQQMKALHSALSGTFYNQQSAASVAFSVASFTNLNISYGGAGNGNVTIRVANSNDPGTAYAYYPSNSIYGGDSFFGNFYDPYPTASLKTPVAGNYAWYTYLHEMGHSLGLKHSQETGGVANVAVPFDYDNSEFTVMSYRSYAGAPIDYIHFGVWGAPQTYMMLDIAALQQLYGADYTVNSGNTTYVWTPTSGNTVVDGQVAIAPGANVIFATVWDGGGNDTYDLSAYTTGVQVNLTPGQASLFSSAQASDLGDGHYARGNIYNALTFGGSNASLIENAIGGSGNDTLTGNDVANTLTGNGGNDTLNGGLGADIMIGGTGDDTYTVDNVGDVVTENFGEGTDMVNSSVNYALTGTYVETLQLTGSAVSATGNSQANTLIGNASNNTLTGLGGNDILDGAAGADTMAGGTGDDTYTVDNVGDVVTENFGEGTDTVNSSVNYALTGTYVETLQLTGSAVSATGNSQANTLIGNASNNTLTGLGGNDTLDGAAGADTMVGGTGDDTYTVDNVGDVVTENFGEGTDTVKSSVNYALTGTYVETLQLIGSAVSATGNSQANTLIGNASNNTLTGLGGNDTLDGAAGADTMVGGTGDDTYYVDNVGDVVTENFGEGTDTVSSLVSYALTGTYVETLQLAGTAVSGTGNSLDNTLIGNGSANTLTGLGGNDTLNGGLGADTMLGGIGNDIYYVDNVGDVVTENLGEGTDTIFSSVNYALTGTYVETLQLIGSAVSATGNSQANTLGGNASNNTLTGLGGNDILDGAAGADTMVGGTGDDTYYVDNVGDVVTENFGEGTDTIFSSVNYALTGTYVETLQLTGSAVSATGNSLDNTLIGNGSANTLTGLGGNDTLNGGLGADTMLGGIGNDIYYVDNVGDVVTENFGEGTDTVYSSVNYALTGTYVETLQLTGSAVSATGNSQANTLIGNSSANTLSGLGGSDVLDGGLGADTLTGGTGTDTFAFSTAIGPTNIDTITDFVVADDTIQLSRTVFAGLVAGMLDPTAFFIGSAAADASDRIIYNSGTGALLYDVDGLGGTGAVQFATLATGLALTNADFIVV